MADTKETPKDVKPDGEQGGERTFTQAEVDALMRERVNRLKGQYADYDDLKAKATAWAEYEEKQKSELQKANERAAKAEQERLSAIQTAQARIVEATFIATASSMGVKYPRDAYALALANGYKAEFENDAPAGVDAAVKALVDAGRLPLSQKPVAPDLNAGAGSGARPGDKPAGLTPEQREQARRMGLSEEVYAKGIKGA